MTATAAAVSPCRQRLRGARRATIAAIGAAFAGGAAMTRAAGRALRRRPPPLGVHARRPARARSRTRCCAGARAAVERIDVIARRRARPRTRGQHPHVGALDVAPVVYLDERARGAACAEALVLADRIGEELGVPVFLYGELTRATAPRARAPSCAAAASRGLARADAPPASCCARLRPARAASERGRDARRRAPPLVAFNLQLAPPGDASRTRGGSRR